MMKRSCLSTSVAVLALLLAALAPGLAAQPYSFRVKHNHTFGGCQGTLLISDTDIRYTTDFRSDARIWAYRMIKRVERKGLRKLTIRTYEDQPLQLGRDKPFEFHFLDSQVTNEAFNFLVVRVGRPPESPAPALSRGRYELAVKHTHTFGGCEGTLKITETHIEYVTPRKKDSRLLKYIDIKYVQQSSAYQFSIATYEDQTMQFGRDKVFNFQLKEAMPPAVLDFIRSRVTR